MPSSKIPTEADRLIKEFLGQKKSFSVIAGAGSGKTTSLVDALDYLRYEHGKELLKNGQKIVCITYTNRAVDIINSRLGNDKIFLVSTIHGFLWGEVGRFHNDLKKHILEVIIPEAIEKNRARDNGGNSIAVKKAREKVKVLERELTLVKDVEKFTYRESTFSDYSSGQIGHEDVIKIASGLILDKPLLRKMLASKYPYFFVDEAQDTFDSVINAFNAVCADEGLPIVGYFGDPMQRIYENGDGEFKAPGEDNEISKEENFRSAKSIVKFANSFRNDLVQVPKGPNSELDGSVCMVLIRSEEPAGPRRRYTQSQVDNVLEKFDLTLEQIGWNENTSAKHLFLVRQMIARRLGFSSINTLFNSELSSTQSQNDYESGAHFLLKPFIECLFPIIRSFRAGDHGEILNILRNQSPAFDVKGPNSHKLLKDVLSEARTATSGLADLWDSSTTKDILKFAGERGLFKVSDRLEMHLKREKRIEEYNDSEHAEEKSDWLADSFFEMGASEIGAYVDFVVDNTPMSTQHGSKGEEYDDVLVVFDDIEAAWNNYSFSKLLTPLTSGEGTEGQISRSRKLAYVCFSRAMKNLRIFLFTLDPEAAKKEIVDAGLLTEDQVIIS